jgi:hypothetical protein
MALDRTWYNGLIDDDGSGLTGSVWDKADVDALMDAIDAEIARLEPGTVTGWQAYAVQWFTYDGAPVTLGDGYLSGEYRTLGQDLEVRISFQIGSSTVIGAQPYAFSLPFPSVVPALATPILGVANLVDASAGNFGAHVLLHGSNTSRVWLASTEAVSNGVSTSSPFAWSPTDSGSLKFLYTKG